MTKLSVVAPRSRVPVRKAPIRAQQIRAARRVHAKSPVGQPASRMAA